MRRDLRLLPIALACACTAALLAAGDHPGQTSAAGTATCAARAPLVAGRYVEWYLGPAQDAVELDQWCRGVGPPIFAPTPGGSDATVPPPLEELTVLTWNAHLAEGRLRDLIGRLRAGAFTSGRPVKHFVILLQELYRGGRDVPSFTAGARAAFAIVPRNPRAADARDYAASLGLSILYVPSMRNGAALLEDRGNAIVSTEPLIDPLALELPLERQRRVAIGTAVHVTIDGRIARLELLGAHLRRAARPVAGAGLTTLVDMTIVVI